MADFTHLVDLWLNNEEPTHTEITMQANDAFRDWKDSNVYCEETEHAAKKAIIKRVAPYISDMLDSLSEATNTSGTLLGDLISTAISEVDTESLAESFADAALECVRYDEPEESEPEENDDGSIEDYEKLSGDSEWDHDLG